MKKKTSNKGRDPAGPYAGNPNRVDLGSGAAAADRPTGPIYCRHSSPPGLATAQSDLLTRLFGAPLLRAYPGGAGPAGPRSAAKRRRG